MIKGQTWAVIIAAWILLVWSQKKTANLNQNQSAVTANPGQLTRNPLDGQLYYYFDPSALGTDPNSDSLYGTPTVSATATPQWNVAAGDGIDATDPNVIGQDSVGQTVKWTY